MGSFIFSCSSPYVVTLLITDEDIDTLAMARPLDNSNPVIFSTPAVAGSSRRRPASAKALLWQHSDDEEFDISDGEREEIDAEEIYGA